MSVQELEWKWADTTDRITFPASELLKRTNIANEMPLLALKWKSGYQMVITIYSAA